MNKIKNAIAWAMDNISTEGKLICLVGLIVMVAAIIGVNYLFDNLYIITTY